MAYKVLGLVDCFNNPEFGPLTQHRLVASTSFLGRYAFIDFPLSNFLNSSINSIGILCQKHIRSLSAHVGNGRSWTTNTKIGNFSILYDEPNVGNPGYSTDVACLFENIAFLKENNPDYIVITNPYNVFECDFKKLVEDHVASGSRVSLLYHHVESGLKTSFRNQKIVTVSPRDKITHIESNKGDLDEGDVSLGTIIMDYPMLESLMEYAAGTSAFFNISDVLTYLSASVLIRAVKFDGFVRCYDSLTHYLSYSLEMLQKKPFKALFNDDWPIHTKTYDTPPTIYKSDAQVTNSYIANGCVIEGTVESSILGRNAKVHMGALVKNSIIGSGVIIGEDTVLENVIVDRNASVIHVKEIRGTVDNPVYIARGEVV